MNPDAHASPPTAPSLYFSVMSLRWLLVRLLVPVVAVALVLSAEALGIIYWIEHRAAGAQTPVWLLSTGGIVAAALLVALAMLILRQQWIKPTRHLAAAAELMADGQWNARVDLVG